MKRMLGLLIALLVAGSPVWAAAKMTAGSSGQADAMAMAYSGMKALHGAASSYDPATRVLTLTNGKQVVLAPHLTIAGLEKGVPFDGTYRIKDGKDVLYAFWIRTERTPGARL